MELEMLCEEAEMLTTHLSENQKEEAWYYRLQHKNDSLRQALVAMKERDNEARFSEIESTFERDYFRLCSTILSTILLTVLSTVLSTIYHPYAHSSSPDGRNIPTTGGLRKVRMSYSSEIRTSYELFHSQCRSISPGQ
jgi:hypothetical protein